MSPGSALQQRRLCFDPSGSFDPQVSPAFLPPVGMEMRQNVSLRAAEAAAAITTAFAHESSSGGERCRLVACSAPIVGRHAGFGSWLNSYVAGARHAFRLGWRAAPLVAHTELARAPAHAPASVKALCRPGKPLSIHCLLRHVNETTGCDGEPLAACAHRPTYNWRRRFRGDTAESTVSATFRGFDIAHEAGRHSSGDSDGGGRAAVTAAVHSAADRAGLLMAGGSFWSIAMTTAHLLAPSHSLRARIDAEARALGLDDAQQRGGGVLAMHVRRGDSCSDPRRFRRCGNISEYAHAAAMLSARYGYKALFLMTDSEEVQQAMPAALVAAGWPQDAPVLARADATRAAAYRQKPIESVMASGLLEPWAELHGLLIDLHLASRCDGLVGKFTSNLDQIALALMWASARCARPYLSLDAPWCFGSLGWSPEGDATEGPTPDGTVTGAPMGSFACGP